MGDSGLELAGWALVVMVAKMLAGAFAVWAVLFGVLMVADRVVWWIYDRAKRQRPWQ